MMAMELSAAMNEQSSDARLIEACRQGDREAFRQLFEAHKDRVWAIALHFARDEAAARDISQQVFLKLFTAIGQFRQDANFTTWLYRVVVNACLDEQRHRRRFISFDIFGAGAEEEDDDAMDWKNFEQPGQRPQQEDRCAQIEISAAVKAAVKELRPKLRIAILLKYFEELSYEEMARVLGCSTGTVASRLNRGHKELARKLAHLNR
jgi:RNA polymerase sigma-70 factor (ECF subfamily)